MKTIKNIAIYSYLFLIAFSMLLGSLMEYFGNTYGRLFLIPAVILAMRETYKND